MKKIKKIVKVGNSCAVVIDSQMLYKAELKLGDQLGCKCTKNKIVLEKLGEIDYEK